MAKFKFVTDVSKLGLLENLARTRSRLVVSTLLSLGATYGLGVASAHYVLELSQSVVVNIFIITGNMFLVLVAAFLSTVLAGDLLFSGPWREEAFLGDESDGDAPVQSHSGEFMVLLILFIVGHAFGVDAATGGFLSKYHSHGYFRVQMRSDAPSTRTRALDQLTARTNYQLWEQPEIRTVVRDALDDPSVDVRSTAAWAAGRMDLKSARPDLIARVREDDHSKVRRTAATALGKLGHDRDTRLTLEQTLQSRPDDETVRGALRGLGLMESAEAVDAIVPLLEADDEGVWVHAYWALRKIGSDRARDAVWNVIQSDPTGTRKCAAFDAFKTVAHDDDALWAQRQYQSGDFETECEERTWEERHGTVHRLLIGDSFREKLLKIVANQAARDHRDWFQRITNDPSAPDRLRQVASEVLRQLR